MCLMFECVCVHMGMSVRMYLHALSWIVEGKMTMDCSFLCRKWCRWPPVLGSGDDGPSRALALFRKIEFVCPFDNQCIRRVCQQISLPPRRNAWAQKRNARSGHCVQLVVFEPQHPRWDSVPGN